MLTEAEALARLGGKAPITYEDLDDIFTAFGFRSAFELPNRTWYRHPEHDCGEFRAEPRYDFSVLSDAQRAIVRRMIEQLQAARELEE